MSSADSARSPAPGDSIGMRFAGGNLLHLELLATALSSWDYVDWVFDDSRFHFEISFHNHIYHDISAGFRVRD